MSGTTPSETPSEQPAAAVEAIGAEKSGAMTHREVLVVIGGLMVGLFLAALDQTIVATALPTIVGELGGIEQYSWTVTAYLLTATASTPLYGKIGDLYGRKSVFQAAVVIFIGGSLISAVATNMGVLIAGRAVQGLGAGGLIALTLAIVGDIVSPRERGRYQGLFGAVFGISSVLGPLLGGFFTESLSSARCICRRSVSSTRSTTWERASSWQQ
jgi:MFS family permease